MNIELTNEEISTNLKYILIQALKKTNKKNFNVEFIDDNENPDFSFSAKDLDKIKVIFWAELNNTDKEYQLLNIKNDSTYNKNSLYCITMTCSYLKDDKENFFYVGMNYGDEFTGSLFHISKPQNLKQLNSYISQLDSLLYNNTSEKFRQSIVDNLQTYLTNQTLEESLPKTKVKNLKI